MCLPAHLTALLGTCGGRGEGGDEEEMPGLMSEEEEEEEGGHDTQIPRCTWRRV